MGRSRSRSLRLRSSRRILVEMPSDRPTTGPTTTHDNLPTTRRRYRLVVACTANLCRSVMAEHLWRAQLATRGIEAVVLSTGTLAEEGQQATPFTVAAMEARGIDVGRHVSKKAGLWLRLSDLIVTVGDEHVRDLVAFDSNLWSRTFSIRDLVRRATAYPRESERGLHDWLLEIGSGRQRMDLLWGGGDDIEDPTSGSLGAHIEVARQLDGLFSRLTLATFGNDDGLGHP